MLQAIHDKAKGWIAYVIVGFIIVPFALWGINSYLDGGQTRAAAVVNGEDVPARDVQSQLLQIRQRLGQMAASMGDDVLKQMALDNVVNQVLLRQKAASEGYRASNQEVASTIAGIEAFQKDGKFDPQQYQAFLQMQRRNQAEFERQVREDLTLGQFRKGVTETAFVPKAQAELYQSLREQKRDLELFTVKIADFESQVQIPDEQINTYYEENKARFMTDEKVKLAYLELNQDDLAATVEVTDEAIQAFYDEHADRYVTPASRNASHILVSVDESRTEEAAKKLADSLYADITAGTRTFEDAAKTSSDDKLSAENGGLVGDVVAGDWDPEFEKAVFAQDISQVGEPVKTGSGYEIIRVNSSTASSQKALAEVRAQVEDDYRRDMAEKLFLDKAEVVQTIAFEQSGDLAPAVTASGVAAKETDWVTRAKGEGIAANPKVLEAAFSDEVQKQGKNSELIQLSDTHAVVIRVIDQQPAVQKPLDEVKTDILNILKAQEARKLVAQKGETLLKQVTASDWTALEASGLGKADAVEKPGKVGRTGSSLQPSIIATAFGMSRPAEGQAAWDSVVLPNGDYVVLKLKSVENGPVALDDTAKQIYDGSVGSRELEALLQSLRDHAEIELHPENI